MTVFDAPDRETCLVRRSRTNTPLQALVTLNDPVYVEAAQGLARRIVREGGSTPQERIRFGLELVLSRPASSAQVAELSQLFAAELTDYQQQPDAAQALATGIPQEGGDGNWREDGDADGDYGAEGDFAAFVGIEGHLPLHGPATILHVAPRRRHAAHSATTRSTSSAWPRGRPGTTRSPRIAPSASCAPRGGTRSRSSCRWGRS